MNQEMYEEELKKIAEKREEVDKDDSLSNKDKKARLKELKKQEKKVTIEYRRRNQGKIRDFFSSLVGNVDKKIHNFVYKEDGSEKLKKVREKLWNWTEKRFYQRYESPVRYLLKNTAILAGLAFAPWLLVELVPAAAGILGVSSIISGVFAGQTVIKAISAI